MTFTVELVRPEDPWEGDYLRVVIKAGAKTWDVISPEVFELGHDLAFA